MATTQKTIVKKLLCEDISYQAAAAPEKRDMERVKKLLAEGIVEHVKIQGLHSRNMPNGAGGRDYLLDGLDPALYDRRPSYINHPPGIDPSNQADLNRKILSSRDVTTKFGEPRGTYKKPDGIYAKEYWFNRDHPYAKTFERFVLEAPHMIGFSPTQFGDTYDHGNKEIVERVYDVRSCDIVDGPATTKGILESIMATTTVAAVAITPPAKKTTVPPANGKKKKPIAENFGKPEEEEEEGMGGMGTGSPTPLAEDEEDMGGAAEGTTEPEPAGLGTTEDDEDEYADDLDTETDDDEEGDDVEEDDEAGEVGGSGIDITPEIFTSITKVVQSFLDKKCDEKVAMAKIKHLFGTHKAVMSEAVMATIEKDPATFLRKHENQGVRTAARKILLENTQFKNDIKKVENRKESVALCEAQNLNAEIAKDEDFLADLDECKDAATKQRKIRLALKHYGVNKAASDKRPKSAGQMSAKAITEGTTDATPPEEFDEKKADEALDKLANQVLGAASVGD